jgi:uncharacterized membrane protein YjfL (UPF0719 family)
MITQEFWAHFMASIIYAVLGMGIFFVSYWVLDRVTPFSLHKELADEHNTAIGIVVGSMMIGLGIIIGAAIHG